MTNLSQLTTREAAAILGCSVVTLCRWVRNGQVSADGKLPGLRGAYLFDPAYIDQLAAERAA